MQIATRCTSSSPVNSVELSHCDKMTLVCGSAQVYDATNGTSERREWLVDVLSQQNGFKVLFVESVCTDSAIVDGNIRVCFV